MMMMSSPLLADSIYGSDAATTTTLANYKPCGIENPGSLCYMISILQQLYACDRFRESILSFTSSTSAMESSSVLSTLHELFSSLLLKPSSEAIMVDQMLTSMLMTGRAASSSSSTPSIDVQQDVAQYFSFLSSRIEASSAPVATAGEDSSVSIKASWVGGLVHIVQRGATIDMRPEKFFYVSLNVRGSNGDVSRNNLRAALQDFTSPLSFPISGAEIVKTCKFEHLPSRMFFHLKRFDYSYSAGVTLKINEYFSFPQSLDMSEFLHKDADASSTPSSQSPETNSSNMFALSGVIVHKGSASSGHYYSLVRRQRSDGSEEWIKLDDAQVTLFDATLLDSVCFGKRGRSNLEKGNLKDCENAIMVVYDKIT